MGAFLVFTSDDPHGKAQLFVSFVKGNTACICKILRITSVQDLTLNIYDRSVPFKSHSTHLLKHLYTLSFPNLDFTYLPSRVYLPWLIFTVHFLYPSLKHVLGCNNAMYLPSLSIYLVAQTLNLYVFPLLVSLFLMLVSTTFSSPIYGFM